MTSLTINTLFTNYCNYLMHFLEESKNLHGQVYTLISKEKEFPHHEQVFMKSMPTFGELINISALFNRNHLVLFFTSWFLTFFNCFHSSKGEIERTRYVFISFHKKLDNELAEIYAQAELRAANVIQKQYKPVREEWRYVLDTADSRGGVVAVAAVVQEEICHFGVLDSAKLNYPFKKKTRSYSSMDGTKAILQNYVGLPQEQESKFSIYSNMYVLLRTVMNRTAKIVEDNKSNQTLFEEKRINPIHCHFGTETHFKYSIHIIRELVLQDTRSIGHVEVQKVRLISPKDYAGNSLKGFRMKRTLN
ncbi:hypothetical protein ACJX0J_031983 [Zea mays]